MPNRKSAPYGFNAEASIVGSVFGTNEQAKFGGPKLEFTEEELKKKKRKGPNPQGMNTTSKYYKGPKF